MQTRHEIYRKAVDHLQKNQPDIQARYYVASRLGMTYGAFSAVLEGRAQLTVEREDHLAAVTGFNLYDELSKFAFPKKVKP